MLSLIPWDVRLAGALMLVMALAAIFEPGTVLFVALYAILCGYIAVSAFKEK
jgi:hypothetical protein